MNIFEQASRKKLRFSSAKGLLAVEDLWDLPLTKKAVCLDSVAKGLNREIKQTEEESFVVQHTPVHAELQLKFDIVKHVIAVKLEKQAESEKAEIEKTRRAKIMEAIESKEDEALNSKSLDELKAMIS